MSAPIEVVVSIRLPDKTDVEITATGSNPIEAATRALGAFIPAADPLAAMRATLTGKKVTP